LKIGSVFFGVPQLNNCTLIMTVILLWSRRFRMLFSNMVKKFVSGIYKTKPCYSEHIKEN